MGCGNERLESADGSASGDSLEFAGSNQQVIVGLLHENNLHLAVN